MGDKKNKKVLIDENYVHCTICGNYRNINSFAHRKSYDHQNRLTVKLQKISFYLSKKKKSLVVIHDAHWPEKDFRRLCHFCGDQYSEHHIEDDFVTESLGSLYHHACSHHSECVKHFLKKNYRKEKVDKFCIKNEDLDRYLQKVPDAKQKYLKKMDFINNMILKQIKDSEKERKTLINFEQVESSFSGKSASSMCENSSEAKPAVSVVESSFSGKSTSSICEKTKSKQSQAKSAVSMGSVKNNNLSEVPPWLKDVINKSSECQPAKPIIGPTFDTLLKHVATEKKNGLLKNRIRANFKHYGKSPSKWLPSYQGVWNQGRRKQLKVQFSRRNQN